MNERVDPASTYGSAPMDYMGPTLLSKQPLTNREPDETKENANWRSMWQHLEGRLASMRNWRYPWWAVWAVLARYFDPKRYIFLIVANRQTRGSYLNDAIMDNTGVTALRTCAAGLWTGLTSPSRPWFKLDIALPWIDVAADGKAWLKDTQDKIYTLLKQSNFYEIMAQAFSDVALIGTAPVIIYEDDEDGVRFFLPCAGEYFCDLGARLDNDTLYREYTLNVIQIVGQFTVARCPHDVVKLWKEGGASLQFEFVIAHAIEPNFAVAKRGVGADEQVFMVPDSFKFREVYWLRGIQTQEPLSRRGFNTKPAMTLKWSSRSNDAYGRGPTLDAIGDNKQVQLQTLREAEFIEKGVRPPMGADPRLKNEPYSTMAGMTTFVEADTGKPGFWPLFQPQPQWLPGMTANKAKAAARIDKALYVDVFLAITRMEGVQPRNELELTQRNLERLQELGPIVNLAEKELDVCMVRLLDIMTRRKLLKPAPASLRGVPLKITYTSIMRQAQKGSEAVALKDFLATAGAASSAAKSAGVPDPLRTVNWDKFLAHYGELVDVPSMLFYSDGEVVEHDKIRHEELMKAQAPEQAMAGVQAAKTLSETQLPNGSSALGALVGAPGQG